MNRQRAIHGVMALLLLGMVLPIASGWGGDSSEDRKLPNPFFAMNFEMADPKLAASWTLQAELLRELGYDGCTYLGPCDAVDEALRAMDKAGRRVAWVAIKPYHDISVDPGQSLSTHLKKAVVALQGRETLLMIQFVSKTYPRGSSQGDQRAVELGRELADFARPYGVRILIYPHVNIWCERIDHAVRIAKACQHDNLGVSFNLFHWLRTDPQGDLKTLVAEAMPHLFMVVINGTSPSGTIETLDRGTYDVEAFLRTFIQAGYRGPIGLQCCALRGDPRENLKRSMEAWRKMSACLSPQGK